MKRISIVIPTFNEEENIVPIVERVTRLFDKALCEYDYRILFIDNCSSDNTRNIIRDISNTSNKIQFIFNMRNFGFSRSTYYGLTQSIGDCSVLLFADMQDPPELIVTFVEEWEKGNKLVVGIKNRSKENPLVYRLRAGYYRFVNKVTEIDHIEQFTGFGLYDRSVVNVLKHIEDPLPYLRGIVAELGPKPKKVYYEQEKRIHGKSHFGINKLFDLAMLGITSYSKVIMRFASLIGLAVAVVSFLIAIITIVLKLTGIIQYPIASAATTFGVFFLGAVQLIFIGILGEYISNINIRTMRRPLVIESERKME